MARHSKTVWTHLRRSPYQAMAAMLIMVITFLMVTVFTFLIVGSQLLIGYFEGKPQVSVFFTKDAQQTQIDQLRQELLSGGKISDIKFVSKDQALQIYKDQNKNDPLLLELVTADILPASFEISTFNVNDLNQVAQAVKSSPIVSEVVFQKDVVSTLTAWTNGVRQVGIGIITLLTIESLLVMVIIISITIAKRRHEIEIMQLIGATKWYISLPFVIEGIIYAVTGAVIGSIVGSALMWYYTSTPLIASFLTGIPFLPIPWTFYIMVLIANMWFALILGFCASMFAVNRYLRD